MSFPQFGYPYPSAAAASSLSSSQLLMSSSSSSPSSGSKCCEGGRPIMTDPHTGQTVCSCQYSSSLLSYPRVAGLPESVYSSAFAAQGYMPFGADPSAFYSPLNAAAFELKEGQEALRSLAQPAAYYSYDPSMAGYPYGYGGMDLNAAARRKNATRENTNTLKAWLYEHRKNPYPTKGEKIMLAIITKMTLTQVSTWFANARRRLKKENKMTWSPRNRTDDDEDDRSDIEADDDRPRENVDSGLEVDKDSKLDIDDSDDEFIDAGSVSDRVPFPDPASRITEEITSPKSEEKTSRPASPTISTTTTTISTSPPHQHQILHPTSSSPPSRLPPHPPPPRSPDSVVSAGSSSPHSSPPPPPTAVEDKPAPVKPRIWSLADVATSTTTPSAPRPLPVSRPPPHPHSHPHPHPFPPHMNGLRTWMNGAFPGLTLATPYVLGAPPPHHPHHPHPPPPPSQPNSSSPSSSSSSSPSHALSAPPRAAAVAPVHLTTFGGMALSSAAFKPHEVNRTPSSLPTRLPDSPKSSTDAKLELSSSQEKEHTAFRPVAKRVPQL